MKDLLYFLFCVATAMIGYQMHGSLFWAIINFLFAPIAWLIWIIRQDVTLSIIKQTFNWFFA